MNEKELRNKYEMLKFQEMFERDENKRKELTKQLKKFETTNRRNEINAMFDDDDHAPINFDNDETMEIKIEEEKTK